MKAFIVSICIAVMALSPFATVASDNIDRTNPYAMIEEVGKITFDRFAREEKAIRANPELLKEIVREELMPHIYYQYAGLKVLGHYARPEKGASKQQVNEHKQNVRDFIVAFREYLITSYAQVFTLYEQQKVVFKPAQDFADKKIVLVGVDIIDDTRPPINLQFKVRKNNKTNEWQAFDLVAEGVSLLDAKQKELRTILAQNGIVEVTSMLAEKSARKIVFNEDDNANTVIEAHAGEQ
ncbi:ABC transporter substrate-binding protein [Thalassotalea maritima]|uniref:ABC transporter substrate-binding protein n=1 Tax=Thalassotalea maritima TaxID=3242416 RepID=UPI003528E747